MRTENPAYQVAIKEYESGLFKNKELARRHRVSPSTITVWARRAGLAPRRRGRHRLSEPTGIHRRMLELSCVLTGAKIADRFEVSRQRVHQVLKRWSHLRPARTQVVQPAQAPRPLRCARAVKDTIISFRLSSPQVNRINDVMGTLELSKKVSQNQACRLVLLAALGCSPMKLVVPHVRIEAAVGQGRGAASVQS
jgi:hypothetical protein